MAIRYVDTCTPPALIVIRVPEMAIYRCRATKVAEGTDGASANVAPISLRCINLVITDD